MSVLDIQSILLNIVIVTLLLFLSIYLYFKYSYTYWSRRGIPHIKPKFPLGNNDQISPEATSYNIETLEWYKEFKGRGLKCGGAWSWAKPVLLIIDPDYIKDVLLKDFNYFMDRDMFSNPIHDKKNESLFVVKKDEWRNMRQKLSPVFTSAKMKVIFHTIMECSKPMIEKIEELERKKADIHIKDIVASFNIDIIGRVALGLESNCFADENSKFRQMAKEFVKVDFGRSIRLLMSRICEKTAQRLGINNVPTIMTEFFSSVIENNIEARRKYNIHRIDFLDLMMEVMDSTKDDKNPFTYDNLIANIILFFIAGFDTSTTTVHLALYELSRNPELQEKTRTEIMKVLEKYDGEITIEGLKEMTYLKQVIDETLRLYTPVQTLSRITTQSYTFKDSNITLEKDTTVLIPTMALHRDSDYYPDPERFDPERFNTEKKITRNPYVYLPFGNGPRNCIGMRLGIMQSSIAIIQIIKNFRLSLSPLTDKVTLRHGVFLLQTNEEVYLRVERI
ncbi:hypothetical protein GWI33_012354 [Rhynchophorus ferrugineus]|uniref:Cytochrome P450 n=1 Tax=Rhynchophorus ferrugineus TaxID=354439 RepID=A0A834IRH6_RHYFE|nr:hypothetical protein GWI33_012354 [Rhynchophorus ferrugineus]